LTTQMVLMLMILTCDRRHCNVRQQLHGIQRGMPRSTDPLTRDGSRGVLDIGRTLGIAATPCWLVPTLASPLQWSSRVSSVIIAEPGQRRVLCLSLLTIARPTTMGPPAQWSLKLVWKWWSTCSTRSTAVWLASAWTMMQVLDCSSVGPTLTT
jgi:hypothetical protein